MAKTKRKPISNRATGWNEFNTFSKLIYPYLEETLGYPPRKSEAFDEQTWVRKRGEKSGPYDGAFKDDRGVLVLIEAKKQGKPLGTAEIKQAFDYCLGETFPVPPPYVLVSSGDQNKWFRRNKNAKGEYSYSPCDEVKWKKAKQESGSGELTEQLTLKELIRLLSKLRKIVYQDLVETYFPDQFSLKKNKLGVRKKGFEEVLKTRKTFVDPTLADAEEKKAIQFVLSSIALSITLKILFVKITFDRKSEIFPKELKKKILSLASAYPGILVAKPYDVLDISKNCEEIVVRMLKPVSILQGLIFETTDNPIGDIWDGLVESEEQDLQVQSLGNVYTPDPIVKVMVSSAEKSIKGWRDKNVLEPSCGSGHFVREIYKRLRDTYLTSVTGARISPANAHIQAMAHIRAIDIDPFAVQTTQLGMFLELYREQNVWKELAPRDQFDFSKVVDRGDFLDDGFDSKFVKFQPDLIIGNPPYGVKVSQSLVSDISLGSKDSYGFFIYKAVKRLNIFGRFLFVLSNTFMTISSHFLLRKFLLENVKLETIIQLHRNSFPKRDVFPCILTAQKISQKTDLTNSSYRYYDTWPIHPVNLKEQLESCFNYIIDQNLLGEIPNKELFAHYDIPQEILSFNNNLPIFGASPKLFLFCLDSDYKQLVKVQSNYQIEKDKVISVRNLTFPDGRSILLTNLDEIADSKVGLQTGNNKKFVRKSEAISGGPVKGGYDNINYLLVKEDDFLESISSSEDLRKQVIQNGIEVLDRNNSKYFVPYNKGSEQKTDDGEVNNYWNEVEYWIDWSEESVNEMKNSPRARFQNDSFYFKKGITYSYTGLYSPTFRMNFIGPFDVGGSSIFPRVEGFTEYLLGVLCCSFTKYIVKNYIEHTPNTQKGSIERIPIPIVSKELKNEVTQRVFTIIDLLKKKNKSEVQKLILELDDFICANVFKLNTDEIQEVKTWFKRRYPHFGKLKLSAVV